MHEVPVDGAGRHETESTTTTTSSHSHRNLYFRGRHKNRDKNHPDAAALLPRPSKEASTFLSEYRRNHRNLDSGAAASTSSFSSSQTRLLRASSPTPSVASAMSNPPRSPPSEREHNGSKKASIWGRIDKFVKYSREKPSDNPDRDDNSFSSFSSSRLPKGMAGLRSKSSEPLLTSGPAGGSTSPASASKRGSGGHPEPLNPRAMDYPSAEHMTLAKTPSASSARAQAAPDGTRHAARKGSRPAHAHAAATGAKTGHHDDFRIDTDFSDLDQFVKRQTTTPPDPGSFFFDDSGAAPVTAPTWEPPESWGATQGVQPPSVEPSDAEDEPESGPEDAQYCIRVFRADSTFATLSCKLSATVTEVLGLLGRKSFLQDNLANYQIVMRKNSLLRILGPNERPLKIQKKLLELVGYTEDDHLDEIGREDHGYLVRFTFMMARTGGYSLVPFTPSLPPSPPPPTLPSSSLPPLLSPFSFLLPPGPSFFPSPPLPYIHGERDRVSVSVCVCVKGGGRERESVS